MSPATTTGPSSGPATRTGSPTPTTSARAPGRCSPCTAASTPLGGILGHRSVDTTDEDPARVALVRDLTWAWLNMTLGVEGDSYERIAAELDAAAEPGGHLEVR